MSFNFTVKEFILGGGTGNPTLQFYRRGFNLGGSAPTWRDIVISGVGSLSLTNAVQNGLNYLKAFGGSEQRNVPEGYQELEYIQGTNNTQYINTGIVPTSGMSIYAKFAVVDGTISSYSPFGCRNTNGGDDGLLFFGASASNTRLDLNWLDTTVSTNRWRIDCVTAFGDVFEYKLNKSLAEVKKNGTSLGTHQFTPDATCTQPIYVNGFNNAGSAFTQTNVVFRQYRFTIQGKCDMVPAKRLSDNAIGMWDKVRKQFFTKADSSAADFVAGSVVDAPIPSRPLDIWCNNGAIKTIRPLEYLESTGTQYIDTGIKPNNNSRMVINFYADLNDKPVIAQVQTVYNGTNVSLGVAETSGNAQTAMLCYNGSTSNDINYARILKTDISGAGTGKYTVDINKQNVTVTSSDGSTFSKSFNLNEYTSNLSLWLFAKNHPDTLAYGKCKIYSCKLYDNDSLVRDYIPALDCDNIPCMYDKVEGKCYYNQGTGEFVAPYIPAEYERVEYLKSTGIQYIDTGLQFTTYPFKKVITFSNVVQGSAASSLPNWVNGSWANDSNNRSGGIGLKPNGKIGLGIGTTGLGSSPYEIDNPTTPTTVTIEVLSSTSAKFTGGSTDYDSITYSGGALSGYTDYLFGAHFNGTTSTWAAGEKIYRAEYYNNGVHVADMIPVRRISDGVLGMYDVIRKQFYTNAGSGTFTCDSDYTPLEYIESSGTQYINTGFTVNQDTEVETEWQRTNITDAGFLYGIIRTGNTQVISAYLNTTNSVAWRFSSSSMNPVDNGFLDTNWHKTIQNKNGVTSDGVLKAYSDVADFQTTEVLPIFCRYNVSTAQFMNGASARMKYYTIRQNGVVVFNGIPAKRNSDSAIGMFDTVTKTFFANAGTGTFTAGNEILTPTNDAIVYIDGTVEKLGIHTANNKNLFNGLFEQGVVYNGNYTNTNIRIRAIEPLTLPSGTYTASCASDYEMIFQINNVSENVWYQTKTITLASTDKLMICVRNKSTPSGNILPNEPVNVQVEAGNMATTYEPYYDCGTALCEDLLAIGTVKDVQSILDGVVTRKIGVCVLKGNEPWNKLSFQNKNVFRTKTMVPADLYSNPNNNIGICSHFTVIPTSTEVTSSMNDLELAWNTNGLMAIRYESMTSLANFINFLAGQYNAGTPVIVLYQLATEVTDNVSAQALTVDAGSNTIQIIEASIDDLPLEASYKQTA